MQHVSSSQQVTALLNYIKCNFRNEWNWYWYTVRLLRKDVIQVGVAFCVYHMASSTISRRNVAIPWYLSAPSVETYYTCHVFARQNLSLRYLMDCQVPWASTYRVQTESCRVWCYCDLRKNHEPGMWSACNLQICGTWRESRNPCSFCICTLELTLSNVGRV